MALPKNELILSNFFSVSHFITPWKHQKNSWFSEIFIGYKKSKIWRNGPTDFSSAGFFSLIDFFFWNSYAEKYQEPTQTSKMELFAKSSISDACMCSEHISVDLLHFFSNHLVMTLTGYCIMSQNGQTHWKSRMKGCKIFEVCLTIRTFCIKRLNIFSIVAKKLN